MLLAALPCVALSQDKDKDDDDDPAARREWFVEQRADPFGFLPGHLRLAAIKKLESIVRAQAIRKSAGAAAISGQWTSIGPQPVTSGGAAWSGRVTAIAVDQKNANLVYLGTADGGVWKSTDGGTNWAALTDLQPSLAVGSLALDPQNSSIVYVGTGEANNCSPCYYGAGLLKSTDGGVTWTNIQKPFTDASGRAGKIASIAVSPANSQIVLAAVNATDTAYQGGNLTIPSGVYRSTDAGATWTNVLGSGLQGTRVVFDPVTPANVYATISGAYGSVPSIASGVFFSSDAGVTWKSWNGSGTNAISLSGAGRVEIAIAPSNPQVLYAAVANDNATLGNLLGFYKSTDGGVNWARLGNTPDYCTPQCWYSNVIAVDPTNADIVFAGGLNLQRSTDGGVSWASVSNGVHVDHHDVAFAAGAVRMYNGNDGGVWSTSNPHAASPAWTNLNSTLTVTQFYPSLSIHPGDLNFALFGAQDNSTELYSGSLTWRVVTCGDGGWTAIDPSQSNVAYASCQNIQLEKSTNGGTAWSLVTNGINGNDRVAFIPPFVMDPVTPTRLYFGTYRLWQTTDAAGGWAAVSDDLTGGGTGTIRAIAIAPSDSQTVYSGSSTGQVWVTNRVDARDFSSWTNRSQGLPARFVTQIQVDPLAGATAYVSFSGFSGIASGDNVGHVFRTVDRGGSWIDISGNLPNIPVNDLQLDPDLPGTLYAATDIGVFVTGNAGLTWNVLGTGMPRVVVMGLRLHRATRTLRAATHGRGAWDILVPLPAGNNPTPGIRSVSPSQAVPGSPTLALVLTGAGFTAGSTVQWNGQTLPTTVFGATSVGVNIPAASLTSASISQLTVTNPGPGGGVSNALTFAVVAQPVINAGGIVNAASFVTQALTAGSLASLFGTNLAVTLGNAVSTPLPLLLNSVTLRENNTASPLVFVSPNQINFQIPWELASTSQATVIINVAGSDSASRTLTLAAASPAIFTLNQSGSGPGAVLISNSATLAQPVSVPGARPAAKGESVSVFCTGLGAVSPAQQTAQPAPAALVQTTRTVTATIGAQPATVTFAGLAPGFVGLYQVNITVPANAPSGDAVPLVITINNTPSNMVTLAVQ